MSSTRPASEIVTFGWEIEFVTPYLRPATIPFEDPAQGYKLPDVIALGKTDRTDDGVFDVVQAVLEKAIGKNRCGRQNTENKGNTDYGKWNIVDDVTIEETTDVSLSEYFGWQAVEIISPVCPTVEETEKVMAALLGNFRVRLNATCAFHVHVGFPNDGWRSDPGLVPLKKMVSILWMPESRLASLYHPLQSERNPMTLPLGDAPISSSKKIQQPSAAARETKTQWFVPTASLEVDGRLDKISKIWDEDTVERIQFLINIAGQQNGTYKLHLRPGDKGTVEFRQMEATVDVQEIQDWVVLAQTLAYYALLAPPQQFQQLLLNLDRADADFTVWDLLKETDVPSDTQARLRAKQKRQANDFRELKNKYDAKGGFQNAHGHIDCVPYKVIKDNGVETDYLFENAMVRK